MKFIEGGWKEFSKFTRFKMGDGSKISFCHDVWCGKQSLKAAFLELYSIAHLRDAFVADHL